MYFHSRFTTSDKYENLFQACFRLPSACPRRSGEICNACVLLVKVSIINQHHHHHHQSSSIIVLLVKVSIINHQSSSSSSPSSSIIVLLVKRYQKLPMNSTRHWAHVVDARAGPGVKNFVKVLLLNPLNPFQIIFFFEGATSRELSGAGFEAKACVPPSKEGSKQLNLVGRGGSLC